MKNPTKETIAVTEKKKTWNPPVLTAFGSVEQLTLKNKHVGSSDGLTFNGVPISG
jgi:hypothetical protein